MRLNKMTGRVIAAMMMTQTAGVMAAVRFRQQDADQPQLLYATVL